MTPPINLTDDTFPLATEIQPGLVVVDFWAPWCAPCRVLGPVIDRLADRNEGRVTFAKVNVDENQKTAMQFGVQSIPALLFFKGGELVDRTVGALPESVIQTKLEQLLKNDAPTPQAA